MVPFLLLAMNCCLGLSGRKSRLGELPVRYFLDGLHHSLIYLTLPIIIRTSLPRQWHLVRLTLSCDPANSGVPGGSQEIRRHQTSSSFSKLPGSERAIPCVFVCLFFFLPILQIRTLKRREGSHLVNWGK